VKALVKTKSEPGIWIEDQPEPTLVSSDVINCVRETAMRRSGLDVSPVVTHRIVIAEFAEAIDIKTSTKSAKVIFDWEETA